MSKLTELISLEYKSEYNLYIEKSEEMKPYKSPQIFPKVVAQKALSAFSEKEKQEILEKCQRWYVYYYFKNEDGIFRKQGSIYNKLNQEYKNFDERYRAFHRLRNVIEILLKKGYNPYDDKEKFAQYSCFSSLDFALELKKNTVKPATFIDYKSRVEGFKKHLKNRGLHNASIEQINKKDVNDYLNAVLIKSSPRNRNNTLAVLSSIFSTLEENEMVKTNVTSKIKKLQASPERNKTYTKAQEEAIFTTLAQTDKQLLLFVKFVSYNFLRPIEVCRLQVRDIDFSEAKLAVRAKNKLVKTKIIPEILFKEIAHLQNTPADYFLFTPNGVGAWEATETNKRDYWSKRFKRVIKDELGLGADYGLYSFRHTFITKLYRELRKTYPPFETKSRLMLITGHTSMEALNKYLRDIDAELPADYSHLLKP